MKKCLFLVLILATIHATAQAQPANPLTRVVVEKVWSGIVPEGEVIPAGTLTTEKNHGGKFLCVQVREYGYGTNRFAKINNKPMKLKTLTRINDSYGYIIGWRLIYEFIPATWFKKGTFTYQADSLNYSPYYPRRQSTFVNIR